MLTGLDNIMNIIFTSYINTSLLCSACINLWKETWSSICKWCGGWDL